MENLTFWKAGVIALTSALGVLLPPSAAASTYATPACPLPQGCISSFPSPPNSAVPTMVSILFYSGFPSDAELIDQVISVTGNTVSITATYIEGASIGGGPPPPIYHRFTVPVLQPGSYTFELRLAPDPSYPNPPPVQTSDGTVVANAGVFMTTPFTVVPGVLDATEDVIEYYYPPWGHYFMTADPDEIAALDAKVPPLQDWVRTGQSFKAFVPGTASSDTAFICRFFNDTFQGESSHFYAAQGLGCEDTIANFPDWTLESPDAFSTYVPSASGACQSGTIPLYRVYNNGMGNAPNHRFMTSPDLRQQMIDSGWIPEGAGIGIGMCVPG